MPDRGVIFLETPSDRPLSLKYRDYYISGQVGNASDITAQGVTLFYEILTQGNGSGYGVIAQASQPIEPNALRANAEGSYQITVNDVIEALPLGFRDKTEETFYIRVTAITWRQPNRTLRKADPSSAQWAREFAQRR
jgi:hypothetical protein